MLDSCERRREGEVGEGKKRRVREREGERGRGGMEVKEKEVRAGYRYIREGE